MGKEELDLINRYKNEGINLFNINDEFFLIDYYNVDAVKSRLYGYSIQNDGIYENINLTKDAIDGLDGRGCYIYIEVNDRNITIHQDFNGSYGIYLFRNEHYFALSNSFFRLLDHIKFLYPLTLNRDYANHILAPSLASYSFYETPINEISIVDRNAILTIDTLQKTLQIDHIRSGEFQYSIESYDGIAILDKWFDYWTSFIRKLKTKTNNIIVDLSGGYDSRLTFLLVLCSGIDLNEINVRSLDDKLHTHKEDYEIASGIANYYNFSLNNHLASCDELHYSLTDILNIEYYTKMCFHKEPYWCFSKRIDRVYKMGGSGGEAIRNRYNVPASQFIEEQTKSVRRLERIYSQRLINEVSASISRIMKTNFQNIYDKYKIDDLESPIYLQHMYADTRCRSHFGKISVNRYFNNTIIVSPLIDPDLRKLCINTVNCLDNNLLMALIYERYCPKLIDFPFEGKRSISRDTIEYARKINSNFSRNKFNDKITSFNIQKKDIYAEKLLHNNNKKIPNGIPTKCMKHMFDSNILRGMFISIFDEQIYKYAEYSFKTREYMPLSSCYSVIGISHIINDIITSNYTKYPSLSQNVYYFLNKDEYETYNNDHIIERIQNYITARIGVTLLGDNNQNFDISYCSDSRAKILNPPWYQKNGTGYIFLSYYGTIEIRMKVGSCGGKIRVTLLSKDVRSSDDPSKRIPYWIDFLNFSVNGDTVFDNVHPAWHDRPYKYIFDAKAEEEITIRVAWLPHRSDFA